MLLFSGIDPSVSKKKARPELANMTRHSQLSEGEDDFPK